MRHSNILAEYVDSGIIERMVARGYALQPAKSAGYDGRRGADYHIDMPMRTHILNGLFSVTRLLSYLDTQGIYSMPESDYRRLLAYFTTHDFHKNPDMRELKRRGEFDVPLTEVRREVDALGIGGWVNTTPAEHRVMMIHLPSPKVGDYLEARNGTSKLEPWIHIADALSSMQTARDYQTVEHYLQRTLARQLARRPLAFFWHELDEYRGVSTLLLHQAVSAELAEAYQLFPLLYFPNGVLYIGPVQDDGTPGTEALSRNITERLFSLVRASLAGKGEDIAQAAISESQGTMKLKADAFIFADVQQMISAVRNRAHRKKARHFLTERIGGAITRKKGAIADHTEITKTVEDFCRVYRMAPEAERDTDFSTKWKAVSSFIMGSESIAACLMGGGCAEWLFELYRTPSDVAETITANKKTLTSGGKADHAVIMAYHYLTRQLFGADQRPADAADIETILAHLQEQVVAALRPHDSMDTRLSYASRATGLQADTADYLSQHLSLPFAQARTITSPLPQVARRRTSGYGKLCSFCNRAASKVLKIDLAGIVTTTFSNRRIPSQTVKQMQVWCPMCYLEFMLRERMGLGFTSGYSKADSDRLYLFLLPDYSFTPEFWQHARRTLLQPLESITKLRLRRGYGEEADAPTIPNRWLLHRQVDGQWLDEVRRLFEKTAQEMAVVDERTGRSRRESLGEKIKLAPLESPNFQILVYENSVSNRSGLARKLAPTRSEMWTKAAYAAVLLHALLGVRVYVTDKPYLLLTRPDEMKHIIQLDGGHPLLRNVLPRRNSEGYPQGTVVALADLGEAIDLLSAVWEANAALSRGKGNLDKQVANVLEQVNVEPLAGARFYKTREADKRAIYPAFVRACELLLKLRGGCKLNLAQRVTEASLRLFIPLSRREGKAHRYETVFRTAVEVVKASPRDISDEELQARVAGNVLKRLARIRGGAVPLYGEALAQAAADLAEIVVRDLFRTRCKGRAAQLTHEENALADAIYYLTDRRIAGVWAQHKAESAARKRKEDKDATQ